MKFKFKIGDFVRVNHHIKTWTGTVYKRANAWDEFNEYWVTNAPPCMDGLNEEQYPLLAWESEMEKL